MYSINGAIVFQGSDDNHWFMHLLNPDFRHCFIALENGDTHLIINPLFSHTMILNCDNLEQFARKDAKILYFTRIIEDKGYRGGLCWFNCVEECKAILGIKSFWAFTPEQLYKYLRGKSWVVQLNE